MTADVPLGLSPRSLGRGRPRATSGTFTCARCRRDAPRVQATWPEGRICFTCHFTATHTHGRCPRCGQHRLLPGPPEEPDGATCGSCAGIEQDFRCARCGIEAGRHRGDDCARCALRDDLNALLITPAADTAGNVALRQLVDVLCAAERPESVLVWKRSPKVQHLLRGLGTGTIPLTHDGLDGCGAGHAVAHLRALLQHHDLLPHRDANLARFDAWITGKLDGLPPEVAQPVEQFAAWHHLRRIRAKAAAGGPTQGPVHAAKQEITETIKFLSWLHNTHARTVASCTQPDIDAWLTSGPTTRTTIRTFFVFAKKSRLNTTVTVRHRPARSSPSLTQDQRLAWINELLTGSSESLPYRVAGLLLLLYAQPLVRVVALPTSAITCDGPQLTLRLGKHPVAVPDVFGELLRAHLASRPNLRTGAGPDSPWLFPSTRAGQHLHPNTIMDRLRNLGVNLLGARNRAIGELVLVVPPPLVADALGYSNQVAYKHADSAAEPWSRYAHRGHTSFST